MPVSCLSMHPNDAGLRSSELSTPPFWAQWNLHVSSLVIPLQQPEEQDAVLERLVAAMARHDQRAMATLYDQTIARVYGLALAVTGIAADAEEVACDVFWQAWQQAAQFDRRRGSVLAWLLVMTRTRALDKRRRRKAMRADQYAEFDFDSLISAEPAIEYQVFSAQSQQAVRRSLHRLSPTQRKLIMLAYFRGQTHQELSVSLGLPLGTVKSHIRRGLDVLRDELTAAGVT